MTIDRQQIIEDAAKAIFDVRDDEFDLDEWEDIDSTEHERYQCDARAALPVIVAAVLKPIRELHYPADNDAARTPRCPECLGKAGVHPCGCWADEDQQPVCGHCYWLRSVREPWPCPTVRLLDQIETDSKGGE